MCFFEGKKHTPNQLQLISIVIRIVENFFFDLSAKMSDKLDAQSVRTIKNIDWRYVPKRANEFNHIFFGKLNL